MPAARPEVDGDGKRKEGPPIANIARQIEEVKRQKARMEAKAEAKAKEAPKEKEGEAKEAAARETPGETPKKVTPKKVSAVSLAASAVSPVLRALKGTPVGKMRGAPTKGTPQANLVRLRAATSAAPRRLGVPLRNMEGARPPTKLRRVEASGSLVVKQQVHSDDEGEWSAAPKVSARTGFGYGDSGAVTSSDDEPVPHASGKSKMKAQLVAGRQSKRPDPRGRKILGGLLQHLASARHRLAEEGNAASRVRQGGKAKASRRQAEPQSLGVARLLVKKELLADERRPRVVVTKRPADDVDEAVAERHDRNDRSEERDKRDEAVDQARVEREMTLLQHRLEAHYSLMKNYIRTRTEPTIFYLPVKHTRETKQALQETREAIESKVASLRAHLRAEGESDDDHYEPSEQGDIEDSHLWTRVAEGGSG